MKYIATRQLVMAKWDGIESLSDSDILIETDNLATAKSAINWRYVESNITDMCDMEPGNIYICFSISTLDDDDIIGTMELYIDDYEAI